MDMAIAALSVDMSMAKAQQEAGISILKMAMEADNSAVEEALAMIENLDPALGNNLDIMA